MYGCESWTVKKAECWRIDPLELWCWRRLLRVPWTTRRSNQSTLKEISPGYSLEGLMLKLKLQYFGHLMLRTDSLEKTLVLGKIEGKRRSGWQDEVVGWHHQLNGHESEQAPGVGDGQGSLACCSPWVAELDTIEWMNWTELIINIGKFLSNSACLIYISLKSPIFLTLTISHLLTVHYYCFKTQVTVFKSSENDKSLFLSICVQIMVLFFSIC